MYWIKPNMENNQTPNHNNQINTNDRNSNNQTKTLVWLLEFGDWSLVGVCNLVIGY